MSCGSSMLAMIFSSPPQRAQHSISTPKFNAGVTTVAATAAGTNSPSGPTAQVYAYFVTGALTYTGGLPPSTSNPGTLKLQVWSYPIAPPFH
jgi:hypothetical protein